MYVCMFVDIAVMMLSLEKSSSRTRDEKMKRYQLIGLHVIMYEATEYHDRALSLSFGDKLSFAEIVAFARLAAIS